ncbi:acyl-CoA N-acyltransferase [Thozetella sp. PMI_491]|nr:acyl-CoA N-acyltransferase [Thozetella sp. PMI_491]
MSSPLADLEPQHATMLSTSRLVMRPVRVEDIGALHKMRLNPAVMEYMPGVETELDPLKSYSVKRMQLMMKEGLFSFAVELSSDVSELATAPAPSSGNRPVIGFVGITSPPELFYIFDQEWWGHGYATEALRAFLKSYWENYPGGLGGAEAIGRDYLEAHVAEGNSGSKGVAVKSGFAEAGSAVMTGAGREVPTRVFQVLRPSVEESETLLS